MSALLAVCAIAFSSSHVIPATLSQTYQTAFTCPAEISKIPKIARAPLADINHYFPATPTYWPVLRANSSNLAGQARTWSMHGIHSALLLPTDPLRAMKDSKLIAHLLAAQAAGAIPIASLSRTTPNELRAARYMWCMLGLCPAAWYLQQGLDANLALMPKGLYIVAPYWSSDPHLPLPNRELHLLGHTVLPMHNDAPKAGGTAAVAKLSGYARVFTPACKTRWRWFGITFRRDTEGLHTSPLGRVLLTMGGASVALWYWINGLHSNLILAASTGLGWLAFGLAILNLLVIVVLLFQRRTPKRGENKMRI